MGVFKIYNGVALLILFNMCSYIDSDIVNIGTEPQIFADDVLSQGSKKTKPLDYQGVL